jgi:DeoR/GlpR family transcriptional regulator of sugar metabolism
MVTGTRIYTLLKYDGDHSISELSRKLGVSHQTIHKSVRILKEDGFDKRRAWKRGIFAFKKDTFKRLLLFKISLSLK